MTVVLMLAVCLGAICRDLDPGLDPMPAAVCGVEGELLGLAWLADHPGYVLEGWRCMALDARGRRI